MTDKRERAVQALGRGTSAAAAAQAAGVTKRTLRRWRGEPEFAAAVRRERAALAADQDGGAPPAVAALDAATATLERKALKGEALTAGQLAFLERQRERTAAADMGASAAGDAQTILDKLFEGGIAAEGMPDGDYTIRAGIVYRLGGPDDGGEAAEARDPEVAEPVAEPAASNAA